MTGIKVISVAGRSDSLNRAARIRREIRAELDGGLMTLQSESGRKLAAAVEWAEEKNVSYAIARNPCDGYTFQIFHTGQWPE